MENTRIYIEGLDLAGKSSIIKEIAKVIPSTINHLSLLGDRYANPFVVEAEKLHNDTTVVRERVIDAFCNALEHDLITYDWEHKNVLQDSTFFSRTLAHNGDNPYALEKFNQLITRLPVFTLSIILTANINIRQERLRSRIATNPNVVSPDDMLVINNPNKFLKKEEALIYHTHRVFKSQIIDTSDTSAKEVAEIILKQL